MQNKQTKMRAAGLIIKNKKLLLVSGYDADFYWTPGGKSDDGDEDIKTVLLRELEEELGVDVSLQQIKKYHTYFSGNQKVMNFLVQDYNNEITPREEISKVMWLSAEKFRDDPEIVEENIRENLIPQLIADGRM